jgi:histidine kinase
MNAELRHRLAFKLFLTYLVVILVCLAVLAAAVEIVIPGAFQRHMTNMQGMMEGEYPGMMGGGGMMGSQGMPGMMANQVRLSLFTSFRSGVNEALALAAAAALLAALAASVLVSRWVVAPLQAVTRASRRIADGHYDERVAVPGSPGADELAQLSHAFNQMAERLEHTEQMRSQLLGDVSHELRTPLTAIKGSMEALVDGVLPPDAATFQEIEAQADRLQRLVSDLQELSRVEAGAYELERLPLPLAPLAEAAAHHLERQFKEKDLSLEIRLDPDLPEVCGDQDRLVQVFTNLLSNACQYTPPGGSVTLRASQQKNEVLVSITDTGIGIPAEHLPHLFTRFYRVDRSRSRQSGGGSGIGLTITRHLVEAHGGRIWAESPGPGLGSTFSFTLPAAAG